MGKAFYRKIGAAWTRIRNLRYNSSSQGIEIWTAEDLYNVRNDLDAQYIQMADIDLAEYANWEPIGIYDYTITLIRTPFTGTYNGNGFTITNLTIDNEGRAWFGLFGYVSGGVLQNIKLNNVTLSDSRSVVNDYGCGGLVGLAGGAAIEKCVVEDITFTCTNRISYFGGIIGQFTSFSMVDELGGILIKSAAINVSAIYANTGVIPTTTNWGGVVGYLNNIYYDIEECYATGIVDTGSHTNGFSLSLASREACGGFVGHARQGAAEGSVYIRNCYARVETKGSQIAGGFVGFGTAQLTSTPIMYFSRSYAAGLVVSHADNIYKGGFAGLFYRSTGTNIPRVDGSCYYDTEVSTMSDIGKGIPKTTLEMKTQGTYVDWDFDDIWKIETNSYPDLLPLVIISIRAWIRVKSLCHKGTAWERINL